MMWTDLLLSSRGSGRRPGGWSTARERWAYRARLTGRVALLASAVAVVGAAAVGVGRFAFRSDFFRVSQAEVEVRGASPSLEAELRRELDRYWHDVTDNLCRLDARRLSAALAQVPRVRSVAVRKRYPNGVVIDVAERRPLMIANLTELFAIDEEGMLIAPVAPAEAARLRLPLLTGVTGSLWHPGDRIADPRVREVLAAVSALREHDPALERRFVEWNVNGQGEVTAILAEGTEVRFGVAPPLERIDDLAEALVQKPDVVRAAYIDLRMERQIVYR